MPELTRTQRDFRAAMANLSTAVNVVTTDGPRGRAGMTVSAACSVTDTPPTVLVCINRSSRSHDIVLGNRRLAVNVLGAAHEDVAMRFAGATKVPTEERFAAGPWDLDTHDVPVLRGSCASVVGDIAAEQQLGSHSVLFVEVDTVLTTDDHAALVYYQRRFHSLGAAQSAA